MSGTDPYTDVVELCALLQCLGFSVKSLETNDCNVSQEGGVRTVVINCQASGLHVVMESHSVSCSCPAACQQQNSGFWQVSGITGGKHFDKECGSALLGCLPKAYRERLTKELLEIVRNIKKYNESDYEKPKERESMVNKSASMIELKTPEKSLLRLPSETPTRYRSLDTLTTAKDEDADQNLPEPGPLQKHRNDDKSSMDVNEQDYKKVVYNRQSTYTLSSTCDSMKRRNKTSSPIQGTEHRILESLREAEKTAEDLRNKLSSIVREYRPILVDELHDSSMNSLVLDVSKISVLKVAETSKAQFASTPNLSELGDCGDDKSRSRLKQKETASTSNLASKKLSKEGKTLSTLRRLSPNLFKFNKDNTNVYKVEKVATQESKSSKLNPLFKPKIATPVRVTKVNLEPSPNLSQSRKKYSHVKSTIPRPSVKKE